MQCSRILTRNIPPSLNRRGRGQLRVVNATPEPSLQTHNPSTDSDQLTYRLCELSLQKMQKEARADEPDLRHVLACNLMQHVAQQDLLHRIDTLQSNAGVQALPLLPGADEPLLSEDDVWYLRALELAVSDLERASRKSEIARALCFDRLRDCERP